MENGKQETKTENETQDTPAEVKEEKPVAKTEEKEEKPEEKSEEKAAEPSQELLNKIKNQVEFYFGDINMHRDRFLIEQTKLDEGWIPMSVMLNFKMLASMSTDPEIILKALENSDLMEISEDRRKIRRSPKHPLPVYNEEYRKAQEARTIYMKGFPMTGTYIEKLMTFFNDYEPYENIVMRKYQDKEQKLQFKGSIFVQFKTLEDAKAFMERESIKYGETELIRKWSADYAEEKAKEKEELRKKRAEQKAKKEEQSLTQDKKGDKTKDEGNTNAKDSGLPKGSVIHFTMEPHSCTREDIREALGELSASVAFIDFNKGDKEGWVRLHGENSAKPILDKLRDSKLKLADATLTCVVLEGEEETKYLVKAKEEMLNVRSKYNKKAGRKGRHAQRGRKRSRPDSARDEISAKRPNVE